MRLKNNYVPMPMRVIMRRNNNITMMTGTEISAKFCLVNSSLFKINMAHIAITKKLDNPNIIAQSPCRALPLFNIIYTGILTVNITINKYNAVLMPYVFFIIFLFWIHGIITTTTCLFVKFKLQWTGFTCIQPSLIFCQSRTSKKSTRKPYSGRSYSTSGTNRCEAHN